MTYTLVHPHNFYKRALVIFIDPTIIDIFLNEAIIFSLTVFQIILYPRVECDFLVERDLSRRH